MYYNWHFLIKLSLISVVFGNYNNEYSNVNETNLEIIRNQTINRLKMSIILDSVPAYVDNKTIPLNEKLDETWTRIDASFKNITQMLDASIKKLDEKIAKRLDDIMTALHKNTTAELPCKEVLLNTSNRESSVYSLQSLGHAALRRDCAGRLAYFEARVGIQSEAYVDIWLRDKAIEADSPIRYDIGIGYSDNQVTDLDKYINGNSTSQRIQTPGILSATEFRFFYVRIDNGTLQFGKEGASTPLISDYDASFGSLNYIQFHSRWGMNGAKIRLDCPRPDSCRC